MTKSKVIAILRKSLRDGSSIKGFSSVAALECLQEAASLELEDARAREADDTRADDDDEADPADYWKGAP